MLDRKMRDSTVLPTMKCAQCNQEVHIRMIGQHACHQQPQVPALPPPMKDRGLSSFFGRSKTEQNRPQPKPQDSRKNIESRAFPDAYKPSLQLLDEDCDDFDFDNMLQSAAKGGSMGKSSMYGALSPDAPKRTDFAHGMPVGALAESISPMEFLKTPATAVQNDSESRLAQAREELLSSLPTAGSPPATQSQPFAARRMPSEPNVSIKGAASSLQNDLMQKLAQDDADFSIHGSQAYSMPSHDGPRQPWSAGDREPVSAGLSSPESEFNLGMQPQSSNPSVLSSPSTPVAAMAPLHQRNNTVGRLQTSHSQSALQGANNGHRKTNSTVNNTEGYGSRGGTPISPGNSSREGGLSIGSIMRSQSNKADSRLSPVSPSTSVASQGLGASRPAAAGGVDTQIRLSSRKPNLTRSPSDSKSPTPTHVQGFSGPDSDGSPERKLTRNATAPSAMSNAAKSSAAGLATSGPSSVPKALGELASLMGDIRTGGKPAMSAQPATSVSGLPHINTKLAGGNVRAAAGSMGLSPSLSHSNATSRVPSLQRSGNSGGRGLKSAKLDSLLDDLMGEMQALSAEVRTESDRDSVASSTSASNLPNSPVDAARRRFDSSVSTASTSSTLSVGNVHKRVSCATCGTGIGSKNAIVAASRLPRSGDIPASVQGVELQGRVYCVRDYLKRNANFCASCQQPCEASKETSSNAPNRKRQADTLSDDEEMAYPATPGGGMIFGSSSPVRMADPMLPPSSPPPFSPFPAFGQMDDDDDEADGLNDDLPERLSDTEQREDEGEMLALEASDDDGEDLFGPDMHGDYRTNAHLDHYDTDMVDDTAFGAMDPSARARVEAQMRRRDAEEGRGVARTRIPLAFMQDFEDELESSALSGVRRSAGGISSSKHAHLLEAAQTVVDEERAMTLDDLKDMKGRSVAAWVSESGPRQTIAREFRRFLLSYVDDNGASVYGERIRQLGAANGESLEVTYAHLARARPLLAYFLANAPREMLAIMDDVAMDAVLTMFPDYARIRAEIHVRVAELPTTSSLRDLRQSQLNSLVRISGVVSRRTGVFPQLKYVKFDCGKCGAVLGPFYQDAHSEVRVNMCSNCQARGPFTTNSEQTVYRNYQRLTLQETPGAVPPGRLPRHRDIILLWDLIDCAKPGDEIEVTGIYAHTMDVALNARQGFPVFTTIVEANHVAKRADEFAAVRLTEDDRRVIRSLGRDFSIGRRIVRSIAPSIYGHEHIKTALALALFGGVPKDIGGKLRTRGDINVLMLGDPGTAKSQFLKYIEGTAHRAVFTTGQGASAVGLTASVRKDPVTREWALEGGALVLADRGVCLIDEFDKMNDADRTSIHEAMEQQSISISKAGIVTSLQARCSVLAAANPIGGRYRPQLPFSQNVELTEPILSRFDVLCVVRDEVDPVKDEMLGRFVVQSHTRSHPGFQQQHQEQEPAENAVSSVDVIPQDLLRKYIMYARENVHPRISERYSDKVAHLYAELRRESLATGSVPITVRHIESMVRLAEAHARMHLRDYVRNDDVEVAIRVALEGFISAQKQSVMRALRRKFSKYLYARRDHFELLYYLLGKLVQEKMTFYSLRFGGSIPESVEISKVEFESQAVAIGVNDCADFYTSNLFTQQMFSLDAERGVIVKTLAAAATPV
ncbi:MCM DNA helicase complex subunit [Coemansia sp. IMI 203386]|nr:MCM DNA helicase complex subunit [Coemansia sp. IMI 203386]